MPTQQKYAALKDALAQLNTVLIAFSGGVDSTFLLVTAHDVLGARAVAVTARNIAVPQREAAFSEQFCAEIGVEQIFAELDPLAIPAFRGNAPDRCYHCKLALFSEFRRIADSRGIPHLADGSNLDDESDYRPGRRALSELGAISPLRDAGLTKTDIRELSRSRGLATWDKPSIACLATRFPTGETLSAEKLATVDAAENYLHDLGLHQLRVRAHGQIARIETDDDGIALLTRDRNTRHRVAKALREHGFLHSAIDLKGYGGA